MTQNLPSLFGAVAQLIERLVRNEEVAGLNPVCTDAVAMAAMGYNPRATRSAAPFERCDNTLVLAEAHGVGTTDLKRIDVRGARIEDVTYKFRA